MSLTSLLCFLLGMCSRCMDDMMVRARRMSLALHATYMGGKRNAYMVLLSKPETKSLMFSIPKC